MRENECIILRHLDHHAKVFISHPGSQIEAVVQMRFRIAQRLDHSFRCCQRLSDPVFHPSHLGMFEDVCEPLVGEPNRFALVVSQYFHSRRYSSSDFRG